MKYDMNREDLKNVTLSQATLRLEDLVSAFEKFIEEYAPDDIKRQLKPPSTELDPVDDWEDEFYDSDEYVVFLMDLIDEMAPDGYYFGAHPGDGSLFGFWPAEETTADIAEIADSMES